MLNEALMDSLQKLPVQQRDLIIAHYFDGKTQKTLAAQYGITQQKVSRSIQDGLQKLGKMLKNWKT